MNRKIFIHGGEILNSERYQSMKNFRQHGSVSVHEHSLRVADRSLKIQEFLEKLHVRMNERAVVRGALLHDYFLYDWHDKKRRRKLHGFNHPDEALKNAERDFDLSDRERDIISKHMFPLTITKIPMCREAWVVSAADKWCSAEETVSMRKSPNGRRKLKP